MCPLATKRFPDKLRLVLSQCLMYLAPWVPRLKRENCPVPMTHGRVDWGM